MGFQCLHTVKFSSFPKYDINLDKVQTVKATSFILLGNSFCKFPMIPKLDVTVLLLNIVAKL